MKSSVINIVRAIPKGNVASYGQVALMSGYPRSARQVGWILSAVRDDSIPWWRVVNKKGEISIRNSEYSKEEQKRLLENDGIVVSDDYRIDMERYSI